MTVVERISAAEVESQRGHVVRYEYAATLVQAGDVVLDAACGIGYGSAILAEQAPAHAYYGVDRDGVDLRYMQHGWFTHADLDHWTPGFSFDVGICFETLEHLQDPQHLAGVMALANRVIVVSVPTQPTKHFNHYHLHDFTVEQVPALFPGWHLSDLTEQPEELSHIFTFTREG